MTKLSVNINKIATLRNSRGGNNPDVIKAAIDIQNFGAEGITVHPRPDERHIRYADVYALKKIITTEFNIEGNPKEQKFVDLVLANKPDQVTLVPDAEGQITSDHGWDTKKNRDYLIEIISVFQKNIFMSLQFIMFFSFSLTYFVHCIIQKFYNMKSIKLNNHQLKLKG